MNHERRILHVVNVDQRRGAEVVAANLAAALDGIGMRNRVIALAPASDAGLRLGCASVAEPGWSRLRRLGWLRAEAKNHADLLVAHGGAAALEVATALLGLKIPTVWHRILEMPSSTLTGPQSVRWRWLCRRLAGVIAITPQVAAEVRGLGFRGPTWLIPNHRPWAEFGETDRREARDAVCRELGIASGTPIVGFVGHLVTQKHPIAFVEVAQQVAQRNRDAVFVIAGDGPLRAEVEAAVACSSLGDRLRVLGHRRDIPSLLASLDVLVLVSKSESMTGTVVEAQMSGCPVVSYPLDGVDVAVRTGSTGLVVAEHDPSLVATAVAELLDDPARLARLSGAAREHARQFSTERVAIEYANAFRSLLGRTDDPLRVLAVMPNFGVGGAERALLLIARHASEAGFELSVASLGSPRRDDEETVLPELRALGVRIHDLGVNRRPTQSILGLVQSAHRLRRLVKSEGLDVVDTALLDADLAARFGLRGLETAQVVHLVNTPYAPAVAEAISGRPDGGWRFRTLKLLDTWTAPLTDSFVALTEAVARAAVSDLRLPAGKLAVISRGVSLQEFQPSRSAPVSGGALRVLSVGRLVPQKDHRTTIDAVTHLRSRGRHVALRIAGEGPLEAELERHIAECDVAGAVALLGPRHDVAALHQESDVFVMASRWEGQSNALIEAMASGLPVVVADIPPLREVADDAGLYFAPGDALALAGVLDRLAAEPELCRSYGELARTRVTERYSAPITVVQLGRHYREVIAQRRAGRAVRGRLSHFRALLNTRN